MVYIDRIKVMALFLRLSGIEDSRRNEFDDIIENACFYIAKRVKEDILVTDLERLEFASAAVAVYDNTLLRLINDKTLCTADGRQTLSYKDADAYKYAVKLREHALISISDLIAQDTFYFAAAEG
ncbi:MAG: hypothetical protein J6O40_04890 [Ruminococcus sp.]|nr:hypothetical protein [Ruminococcus sp.]